ncbi:MAG: hypothetical protein ACPGVD_05655 [Flavobacteriales bacterium]
MKFPAKPLLKSLIVIVFLTLVVESFSQQKLASLDNYISISRKELVKKYKKLGIKLKRNKKLYFYKDEINQLYFYYTKESNLIHAVLSKKEGLEFEEGVKIPDYIHNNSFYLNNYNCKVYNVKKWLIELKSRPTLRLYKCTFGYRLVDINLTPKSYEYHKESLISQEDLKKYRTNIGDWKDFEYSKFIPKISTKNLDCLNKNCADSGEKIVIGTLKNTSDSIEIGFQGMFKDSFATGECQLKMITKDSMVIVFKSNFILGEATGDFEMDIYKKGKIRIWNYVGKIHKGVFGKLKFKNFQFRVYGEWRPFGFSEKLRLVGYDNKGHLYPGTFEIWGVNKTFDDGLFGTFLYDGTGYLFPFCLHGIQYFTAYSSFSGYQYEHYSLVHDVVKSRIRNDVYRAFTWNRYWYSSKSYSVDKIGLPYYIHDHKKEKK